MDFVANGPYSVVYVLSAVSVIFSLLNCFLGYKLLKLWITLAGFSLGFALGLFGCSVVHAPNLGIYFIVGALLGVALALVTFFFYKAGVFILCGFSAASVALSLISQPIVAAIVAIAVGIAVGALAVVAIRPVVILSTGIGGGLQTAILGLPLFNVVSLVPTLALGIVLAIVGTVVQFRSNPAEKNTQPPVSE